MARKHTARLFLQPVLRVVALALLSGLVLLFVGICGTSELSRFFGEEILPRDHVTYQRPSV
jgi:hypothetical protein